MIHQFTLYLLLGRLMRIFDNIVNIEIKSSEVSRVLGDKIYVPEK